MATHKQYLPAASYAEYQLLKDLAAEHPKELEINGRETTRDAQIFFETKTSALSGFVWFLLARLRQQQRSIEALYKKVCVLPVGIGPDPDLKDIAIS